jgi:cytochrome b subunit of formate dehydrogenase
MIQNEILSTLILERKNYLNDIYKYIGDKTYNEIFGQKIKYLRITQSYINGNINTNLTEITIQFSEAILIICNSFQSLTNITNYPITILNKFEYPFSNLKMENLEIMNDVQKNFYEMIINYMSFYRKFDSANTKLHDILFSKSNFIEFFIYFLLSFDTALLLVVGILMYVYLLCFENTFIKVINYVNMILNSKNDDFNFNSFFMQKIENLETILQFYNGDPLKAVTNLNEIYSKYEQFMKSKIKNSNEMNQKKYKSYDSKDKKNELDNVPKNQRIVNKEDIKRLGITFVFKSLYYFYFLFCFALFVVLIILWLNYFSKNYNLYTLIQKNLILESSLYRSINLYELMIFNNLTLSEITELAFGDKGKDTKENIIIN